MNASYENDPKFRALMSSLIDGQPEDVPWDQLAGLLSKDAELRTRYLELIDLHAELVLEFRPELLGACTESQDLDSAGSDVFDESEVCFVPDDVASSHDSNQESHRGIYQHADGSARSADGAMPVPLSPVRQSVGHFVGWMPLIVGMMIGAAATLLITRSMNNSSRSNDGMVASDRGDGIQTIPSSAPYVARLVSNTGPVWNASAGEQLESGDRLRTKETLTIQEGTAKLELVSGLTLHLEGPAMVSVDAEGMPVVQYGKVVASLPWGAESTAVKTSLGEVQLSEDDIAGIGVFGSGLSVHVFRGEVLISARDSREESLLLSSGDGRTLSVKSSGERFVLSARPGKMFEKWDSITTDLLSVTDSYVASVLESQPVAYWRFEEVVDGQVRNEVSDNHPGTLGGKARLVSQEANHVLEFGFGPNSGYLFVEDALDELADSDYALELWLKPNHYQWSTVLGLVKRQTRIPEIEDTAFLLETVDEQLHRQHRTHSLRFLHRSPPGPNIGVGKSCYSSRDYEPGKWQYVVAVKEGSKMRLYVDGEDLASATDRTTLVPGLNLVVGRLYSLEPVRPYVGQIDELAVYNHALTAKEIKSRYHMLR